MKAFYNFILKRLLILWGLWAAPSVANVQSAIEHIYPLVNDFSKERTAEEEARRGIGAFGCQGSKFRGPGFFGDNNDDEEETEFGLPPKFTPYSNNLSYGGGKRRRDSSDSEMNHKAAKSNSPPIDLVSNSDSSDMEDIDDRFSWTMCNE